MGLVVVGLSHRTAPIELREHLTVPAERLNSALSELQSLDEVQEAVVLSTCNRLEIYARPKTDRTHTREALIQFFKSLYKNEEVPKALYNYQSEKAVHHLFRVASGLDSLVLGENEILGQVKSAYAKAQEFGSTGKITNVLFQRALFVGKQIRTNTRLSEGGVSVGNVAVQLAQRIFGNLKDHRVLLLGAGKMAEVTARHLLSQKAAQIMILNRTLSKAKALADQLNGDVGSMDQLSEELRRADVVICSTSSTEPIISKEQIENIMKERRDRSLYFIDIAVPRNVEPEVHDLDNVYVYNIDDLKCLVEENLSKRKEAIGQAETIVQDMAKTLYEWVTGTLQGKQVALRHQT